MLMDDVHQLVGQVCQHVNVAWELHIVAGRDYLEEFNEVLGVLLFVVEDELHNAAHIVVLFCFGDVLLSKMGL